MKCKYCNSEANNQVLASEGPHYCKLVCASCGRFLIWMPRPVRPIDPRKLPAHPEGAPLPPLTGRSPAQIAFGERCRDTMIGVLKPGLAPNLFNAMLTISDATFWIANNYRPVTAVRWPHEWS